MLLQPSLSNGKPTEYLLPDRPILVPIYVVHAASLFVSAATLVTGTVIVEMSMDLCSLVIN